MKHVYTLLLAVVMMAPGVLRAQSASTELTNLVVFVRFADDAEITHPFDPVTTASTTTTTP